MFFSISLENLIESLRPWNRSPFRSCEAVALQRLNFSSCIEGKNDFKRVYIINGINKNHLSNSLHLLQSNYLIQDSPPPAGTPDRDYWTCIIRLKKNTTSWCKQERKQNLVCPHSLSISAAVQFITQVSWEHLYVRHVSLQHFQAAASFSIIAVCLHALFQSWKTTMIVQVLYRETQLWWARKKCFWRSLTSTTTEKLLS